MLGIKIVDSNFKEVSKVKTRKRKPFDYSKIEVSANADKIIYGTDEMCLILEIYGKYSAIHNAMAEGQIVSGMVEESIKKHKEAGDFETVKREEILLSLCLEREKWRQDELNV